MNCVNYFIHGERIKEVHFKSVLKFLLSGLFFEFLTGEIFFFFFFF